MAIVNLLPRVISAISEVIGMPYDRVATVPFLADCTNCRACATVLRLSACRLWA